MGPCQARLNLWFRFRFHKHNAISRLVLSLLALQVTSISTKFTQLKLQVTGNIYLCEIFKIIGRFGQLFEGSPRSEQEVPLRYCRPLQLLGGDLSKYCKSLINCLSKTITRGPGLLAKGKLPKPRTQVLTTMMSSRCRRESLTNVKTRKHTK